MLGLTNTNTIIEFTPEEVEKEGKGFYHNGKKYIHHTSLHHSETAFFRLSPGQRIFLFGLIIFLTIVFIINWHASLTIIIAVITILYFADLLFNFFLILRSFSKPPEIKITDEMIKSIPEDRWPTYTIFCPLYKEWQVVSQFVSSINNLDYPKDKLDVSLLMEEDDTETIQKVQEYQLPPYIKMLIIPDSQPKTKPKALNYALRFARGKYTVVFDAEDVPDPLQLKKVVIAFDHAKPHIICMQAKLNFYNPHQNILTKVFTAEYSLWFDLVLTGLQSIKAPIPLGGTSNHFRTEILHHLKGWDAFNVTEDCDLGMRIVKKGYKTAIIDSTTHEEANSNLMNWFRQRTRWIKGYIQTYLVHMRKPHDFAKNWREPHVITFQLVVGGKVLSMFINPLMWIITISYFLFRAHIGHFIESFYSPPIFYMGLFSLTVGNFLYMYYYVIGCAKRNYDNIIKYMFLVPFYWLAMSIAAWLALYQILRKPHYWPKTVHGLHLNNKKAVAQAEQVIGRGLVDKDMRLSVLGKVGR